jgi:hypothetical protein
MSLMILAAATILPLPSSTGETDWRQGPRQQVREVQGAPRRVTTY